MTGGKAIEAVGDVLGILEIRLRERKLRFAMPRLEHRIGQFERHDIGTFDSRATLRARALPADKMPARRAAFKAAAPKDVQGCRRRSGAYTTLAAQPTRPGCARSWAAPARRGRCRR